MTASRRTGTRLGPTHRRSGGRQGNAGDHSGGIGGIYYAYQSRLVSARSLDPLSHVALLRGGLPDQPCCCLVAREYQQETSCSEPTGLRPLQAQKESVPFPRHPYRLYAHHIYSSLLIGLCLPSPLSVYFFLLSSGRAFIPTTPGDGTSSRAKCTHCLSSDSDCIFTESTKVCSLLMNALLSLSTWFSQTRGPPKRYVARFVIGVSYLISNLYPISYVDSLETRLEKMEGMLSRVCPFHLGLLGL